MSLIVIGIAAVAGERVAVGFRRIVERRDPPQEGLPFWGLRLIEGACRRRGDDRGLSIITRWRLLRQQTNA